MDKKEAMLYLALGIEARKGNRGAEETLRALELERKEAGEPSLKREMLLWAKRSEKEAKK